MEIKLNKATNRGRGGEGKRNEKMRRIIIKV